MRKNLKLICTAIGLVAVLVMGLVVPGATQQIELPTRAQIVKGLSQLVAMLTASEGDILDVENAMFSSAPSLTSRTKPNPLGVTFAYIPLHPSSRSSQLLHDWLFKDEPFGDYLNLGALYVENDFPGCPGFDRLARGIYTLKLRQDLKVVAFDSEGNELIIGYAEKRQQQPLPYNNITLESATSISGPISSWLGIVLALCMGDGAQVCIKSEKCTTVKAPDGTEVTECSKFEFCISC
ncbi:MAG: hypothetical protein QXX19_08330 [Candidatus Caldarchaeum sp.]